MCLIHHKGVLYVPKPLVLALMDNIMPQLIVRHVILVARLVMDQKLTANLVQMDNIYHHQILVLHAFHHVLIAPLQQFAYHVIPIMYYRIILVKLVHQIK